MSGYIEFGGKRTDELGLVMLYEAAMDPPAPRLHQAELLGGDGVVDLIEFTGDVGYANRSMEFRFWNAGGMPRSEIFGLLHGRRHEFSLSMDPGCTYSGRFTVADYDVHHGTFGLKVDADPYKTLGRVVFRANAAGGVRLLLDNGRARTQPTVEVYRPSVVSCGGRDWKLEPGTWTIEDFWLHGGQNVVSVDTAPDYRHATWASVGGRTWGSLSSETWSSVAGGDAPIRSHKTWADLGGSAWRDYKGSTWIEMSEPDPGGRQSDPGQYLVYFAYDWKDL